VHKAQVTAVKGTKLRYSIKYAGIVNVFLNKHFSDRPERMFRCSNPDCAVGSWFHKNCVGIKSEPSEFDDWFCSEECRETETSIFCVCKRIKAGPTVQCGLGASCKNGVIFHMECVHMEQMPGT